MTRAEARQRGARKLRIMALILVIIFQIMLMIQQHRHNKMLDRLIQQYEKLR